MDECLLSPFRPSLHSGSSPCSPWYSQGHAEYMSTRRGSRVYWIQLKKKKQGKRNNIYMSGISVQKWYINVVEALLTGFHLTKLLD